MQILEDSKLTMIYKERVCKDFFHLKSPKLIEKLYECSRVIVCKSGEYLLREEERITELPILVKGVLACYSFCKDGTEMLNCLCQETNIAVDCNFDINNPVAMDDIKAIEESHVVMISLDVIRKAFVLYEEAREQVPLCYQKALKYQMTFAKNRYMPMDERVEKMMNFEPGLWNRIPEKCKAQVLNVAPEHWTRYKKQHGL